MGSPMKMVGFHVTTPKKLEKYFQTGSILPPVRFYPDLVPAQRWARRVGRSRIVVFHYVTSWPLPDHRPARWTNEIIRFANNWILIIRLD